MKDELLRDALDLLTQSMFAATFEHRWKLIMDLGRHRLARVKVGIPDNRYNCFSYALRLYDRPDYQKLVDGTKERPKALVDSEFVDTLIEEGLLRLHEGEPAAGDIVLYSNEEKRQHAALVVAADGLCRSKWGPGELYEHGVWELPASYGRHMVLAQSIGAAALMARLTRWVADGN